MKLNKIVFLFLTITFLTSLGFAQGVLYRSAVIDVPTIENGGFGNILAGVDIDQDGISEIWAVNDNWTDSGEELIPRIYMYEYNGGSWDSMWSATLNIPLQNTWPPLTSGDLDGDGKLEIIWGPVNNLGGGNVNPSRIVVFEASGDNMFGIPDAGNYLPNAEWTMVDADNINLRPFKFVYGDIDGDSQDEVIFCDRTSYYSFGVLSVNDIPDNGDDSEIWTMEADGKDSLFVYGTSQKTIMPTGNKWDVAFIDSTIYVFDGYSRIYGVKYENGQYYYLPVQDLFPAHWSFKSATVNDIDGNGTKEIVISNYDGDGTGDTYVLQQDGDTLKADKIADFINLGANQLTGGASGDIDNDGFVDFVFGTRESDENLIVRLEYLGGPIDNPSSYQSSILDKGILAAPTQFDQIQVANVDEDPEMEVIYSGIPRGGSAVPIVVIDYLPLPNLETIAAVKIDSDGNFQPDRLGETVTINGTVTSVNFTASANRFSYYIQDATGGMNITKGGEAGPTLEIGTNVVATGTVAQFRGLTQLDIADLSTDLLVLGLGTPVTPTTLTIHEYVNNSEKYEGMLIELKYAGLSVNNVATWPSADSDANIIINDGFDRNDFTLRIDKDTDIDGNPEPVFPINIIGVASQYTSSGTVYDDGYQISPSYYSDFTANVAAPPSPSFMLLTPADESVVEITNVSAQYEITWEPTVDLNGDQIFYQWVLLPNLVQSDPLTEPMITVNATDVLGLMGDLDTITVEWTVRAKGNEITFVPSVDTFSVTFIKKLQEIVHTPGDLTAAARYDGAIGVDVNASGHGITWKGLNGVYTGGLIFGSSTTGKINGLIPSWENASVGFLTDIVPITNSLSFMSNSDFDQITTAKIDDSGASTPYGVEVHQMIYTNTGEEFAIYRYAYVNKSGATLNDFYAGIFVDWDVDGTNYQDNKGGYYPDANIAYQYGQAIPTYFGISALNGASGMRVSGYYPDSEEEGRIEAFSYLSNLPVNMTEDTPDDYRMFIGSSIGTIEVEDTAFVSFAFVAGDNVVELLANNSAAFAKAQAAGFTDVVLSAEEETSIIPSDFFVEQNYPNPFNPTTTIRFGLPESSNVSIKVFDILGKEVAVLANNEAFTSGVHTIDFNATNLASGTYIYRIQFGEKVMSKKMLLLK